MKAAIEDAASIEFDTFLKDAQKSFDEIIEPFREGGMHFRAFSATYPKEQTHLADAYQSAFERSRIDNEYGKLSLKMIDLQTLDELLPMEGGDGGWWRLYEFGAPSIGKSSKYTFISKPGFGKHGEGFMIESKSGKTHTGITKPFHIITRMGDRLALDLENMRRNVMARIPHYVLK